MSATASGTTESRKGGHGFGTAPVFLASIITILGAILPLSIDAGHCECGCKTRS